MKLILIGTVKFSEEMLKALIENNSNIQGVVTSNNSEINSDYSDLTSICKQNKIPCHITDDINSKKTISWIKKFNADAIYCFGWSRLIKKDLISLPPLGIIGYHPAELPKNRGRHPIIWSLVLGLKQTASTFFIMNEDADSGDIVSQIKIKIDEKDNAKTLYDKLTFVARNQVIEITNNLGKLKNIRKKQNESKSNIWRKRRKKDGMIDWRMSAKSIHNLVRGLSKPYPGAHFEYKEKEYKVLKTELLKIKNIQNIEPGKVIDITKNGDPIIMCSDQCIKLLQLDPINLKKGDYL
jgi:methionyl-tRNA formyltransferase